MRFTASLRFLLTSSFVALFVLASIAHGAPGARPQFQTAVPTATSPPGSSGIPSFNAATLDTGGTPGTNVAFTVELRNNGTGEDSFALSFENLSTTAFPATLSTGSPVFLQRGAAVNIAFIIQVPVNAPSGGIDTKRLIARSVANNSTAAVLITTRVITPSPTATTPPTATNTPSPTITPTPTATPTATNTPGPLCRDNFEPNDERTAATLIRVAVPQTHAMCPLGDNDWLVFGGVGGKVYTIDISAQTNGLDLTIGLYDRNGVLLTFNDDFPRDNNAGDTRPRIQSYRLAADGPHYILVRDAGGGGGADLVYTISLQDESYGPTPTLVNELCTDLFEPDGVPQQARLLVIREIQRNHKLCPAADADWSRVFMKVGARYTLRTDSKNLVGADPVMVLADRDGTSLLAFNDDTGDTLDSRIDFSPQVDGYYFVQIKNVGDVGNQFIAYDLYFEQAGVSAGPTLTPESPPTVPALTPTTTPVSQTPPAGTTAGTTTTASTSTTAGTTTTRTTTTRTTTTAGTSTTAGTTTAGTSTAYPPPQQTALAALTQTATAAGTKSAASAGVKGAPPFVNGNTGSFVDAAIAAVWNYTDQAVANNRATRTWMWGPQPLMARAEVYVQSNGGARQVQYFDKARMEITDWQRPRTNQWFVTNGLLVQEMVDGQVQLGDNEFTPVAPAQVNIAGDQADPTGPTYSSFRGVLGRVGDRSGQIATATLRRDGSTGTTDSRAEAKLVTYVPETGHNIPAVFWDFLNQRGPVGDGSRQGLLVNWVFAMGYPISEPYWATVRVGGVQRTVLVQAFQRRVLTYTPANDPAWRVEMGNVGSHYYQWRYGVRPD